MQSLNPMLAKEKKLLFLNLQKAIELEHSTIPPYLTAMFTIDDKTNPFAYNVIRSVVMEEMLHMTLACQVMNAVGGIPFIDHEKFIPEYPAELDFAERDFDVGLIKFSMPAVETFLKIEKPEDVPLNVKGEHIDDLLPKIELGQSTIGEFYEVIKQQLIGLVDKYGEAEIFNGDIEKQLPAGEYYGGGGEIIVVHSLATALFAIDEIVEQGEGTHTSIYDGDHAYFGQDKEVAHFFRFNEIYKGQLYQEGDKPTDNPSGEKVDVNWKAVSNMIDNPRAEHFPKGSSARIKADEFNQLYSQFLHVLHRTFNGEPTLMRSAVGMMYQMKYLALALLNIEVPDSGGKVAGPTFEYIPPDNRLVYEWSFKLEY